MGITAIYDTPNFAFSRELKQHPLIVAEKEIVGDDKIGFYLYPFEFMHDTNKDDFLQICSVGHNPDGEDTLTDFMRSGGYALASRKVMENKANDKRDFISLIFERVRLIKNQVEVA